METDMQRDGGRYEIGLVVDEIEDVRSVFFLFHRKAD